MTTEINISTQLFKDACYIIEAARKTAYQLADATLVRRNWLLGKRIEQVVLGNVSRAEYGAQVIKELSKALTQEYGSGFDASNLYKFLQFFRYFPDLFVVENKILDSLSLISKDDNLNSLSLISSKDIPETNTGIHPTSNLSWTHYRILLQVSDSIARNWYAHEAARENWGVRTLQRNVSSQYYYRMLQTYDKEGVEKEMKKLTAPLQDKLEYIKSPVIAEFLGLGQRTDYHESTLEEAILNNLQKFLLELGKGYAFVARQQHIHTEKRDYYIDLVFYNVILKCYTLFDLKTTTVTHQDVGQMDMYVRMYDELKRTDGDNPTIGILLCADTDDDIARYSMLKGNEQLFATKYLTYLPTKEQLREEIERQKMFYLLQKKDSEDK